MNQRLRFHVLANAFMIESRGRWRFISLNFRADNMLFWHNHDLLQISLGGRRKNFDCALTHDLLKIQRFFRAS